MRGVSGDSKGQWRPTVDDVIRISWGKPAKQKGTGSRGVPHRLNNDERDIFDRGLVKGFIEVPGSGWRKQRRDAPLINTYRSYCDARGQALIAVMKDSQGMDEVVVDFSPLRTPDNFDALAVSTAKEMAACVSENQGTMLDYGAEDSVVPAVEEEHAAEEATAVGDDSQGNGLQSNAVGVREDANEWLSLPIYRLPAHSLGWVLPRQGAKKLAKALAGHLEIGAAPGASRGEKKAGKKRAPVPGGSREKGMPAVSPGKSRRSGGYGIG